MNVTESNQLSRLAAFLLQLDKPGLTAPTPNEARECLAALLGRAGTTLHVSLVPADLPQRWEQLTAAVYGFRDAALAGDLDHEWGVRWPDDHDAVEECTDEAGARLVHGTHPACSQLVTRTVTCGPWTPADGHQSVATATRKDASG